MIKIFLALVIIVSSISILHYSHERKKSSKVVTAIGMGEKEMSSFKPSFKW